MFVTCHITFGQPSNFFGASLEVTKTIRNNKLHFTGGCSILLLKKGKGPWDRIPFFFNDSDIFLSNLILIITSLAILYSQNVFGSFSILVCIGLQVFCVCSTDPGLLNETKGSCFPLSCLCSYQKKWSKQTFFYNDINI